jgi:hypothetical protein
LPGAVFITNDVPGCPSGGLLSGTDKADYLTGKKGEDEIRGLGASDDLVGGLGSDVIYGGPGGFNRPPPEFLDGGQGDDVLHGGEGDDAIHGGEGEDVLYGGDGNDFLDGRDTGGVDFPTKDTQRDELYCGAGKDHFLAGKLDYVSSSCEVKEAMPPRGTPAWGIGG